MGIGEQLWLEGRQEGMQLGRQEGREEGRHEIARNLLATGAGVDYVAYVTGLTFDVISSLIVDIAEN